MAFKMRGISFRGSALKQKELSGEEEIKKEERAHTRYIEVGKDIEKSLNAAKRKGGTTTLNKASYDFKIKKLTKIYEDLPRDEPVNLGFGAWKPYKGK